MRAGLTLPALRAALAMPAAALGDVPEDAMETQRCIWRCLADSRGADDPAYQRCVSRICNGEPPAARQVKRKKAKPARTQSSRRIQRREPASGDIAVRRVKPRIVCVD